MSDKSPDDTPFDIAEALRALRADVRDLRDRASVSLKKNGHTWGQYLGRLITPERVALGVLLVYQAGGQVHQVQTDVKSAIEAGAKASEANTRLLRDVAAMQQMIAEETAANQERFATKNDLDVVRSQITRAATSHRRDLKDRTDPILHRLDLIEQRMKTP